MAELSTEKSRRAKRPASRSPAKSPSEDVTVVNLAVLNRDEMIAVAAYYRAQSRSFEPGHELEDWLAAESEIDSQLLAQSRAQTPV